MLRERDWVTVILSCIMFFQQVIVMSLPLPPSSRVSSEIAKAQLLESKTAAIQPLHNHVREAQAEKEKCPTCGFMDCDCCTNDKCLDCQCSLVAILISLTYMAIINLHELALTYYLPPFTSEPNNLPYRPPILL